MIKKYFFVSALLAMSFGASAQFQDLNHLASYSTGSSDAAETVAFDPSSQKAFFTSSSGNEMGILNVSDPSNPTLVTTVDLSPYGAGPNSIDTKNGIVAVAVEADPKTDNGVVVFFDTAGTYVGQVTVGALPDMVTFNHAGTKLLVANEGEPNDAYTTDPEGSVSIVDLSNGVSSATVSSITFTAFNGQKARLQNKGIRIFGNNGQQTVAQDLEPEYITVTANDSLAYVNCQEANALVVIDIAAESVLDIQPLGYKNHALGTPSLEMYEINNITANWPALGAPVYDGGQDTVMLGGFSGLYYDASESTASDLVFYAVPDRGPNDAAVAKAGVTPTVNQNVRPFKLPDYQGRIVKITLNTASNTATADQTLLYRQDGTTPITGKGNIPGYDEVPVTYADANTSWSNVDYTDGSGEEYHALPYDEFGGDFEGIVRDNSGNFWMCDEYRPAIYKFNTSGTLIDRYVPDGCSQLGTTAQPTGTYGNETLPAVYNKRWANRGFEAIAYDATNDLIYAFIQSPMYNPSSVTKNNSDVIRILAVNAADGSPAAEYVYILENNREASYSLSRTDKIGDAFYTGDGKFLVVERDSEGPTVKEGKKMIFEISLVGATNTLTAFASDTLEIKTVDELVAMGIQPVHKTKVINLPSVGYEGSDKVEGISLLAENQIAVFNDNDFGLAGAGITDNSVLGIITFGDDNGFDASNEDGVIDITNHPTLGMYMPDAIANYNVNGVNYIVTANEGDSRDYDGYSEEDRVKDLTLDATAYPNAATLQEDENLGRLKTTYADGDYDNDGDYDQIYSYGGRSFSIFDEYGNLVFDSGNQFGTQTSSEEAALFNEDEGEFDGRSDDKGVEPEAVAIGEIDGNVYAFIGFERQSAIVVYDITDPYAPQFITYYNNRSYDGNGDVEGDVAPEIIKFVSASNSPNGKEMLIVGYEVSGTVGFIQVGDAVTGISEYIRNEVKFKAYPNPTVGTLNFDQVIKGEVYNQMGQKVMSIQQEQSINVEALAPGMYFVKTEGLGTQRFMKF
ncbi:MAG: calcium-binding protein [Crocinitomicaceae bacterium]|nr:calcium-binding protein [Crocinitomicaceae bacterium]